jgi:hypothetical protein
MHPIRYDLFTKHVMDSNGWYIAMSPHKTCGITGCAVGVFKVFMKLEGCCASLVRVQRSLVTPLSRKTTINYHI